MARRPHFLEALLKGESDRLVLSIERTGSPLATELEPAFDSKTRTRGLLGRSGLAPGAAMIIAPCNAIHMFFMRFPIDVVFAAKDGRVTKVCHDVKPWRMAASFGAFATVELAAGAATKAGVKTGDRLTLVEKDHMKA
jgi:uncharacterized membrane protein (UPF0127 family)